MVLLMLLCVTCLTSMYFREGREESSESKGAAHEIISWRALSELLLAEPYSNTIPL